MSATVCIVLAVKLRTPGERMNVTVKMSRSVFTLSGDLKVRVLERLMINRGQKCSKQCTIQVESNQHELEHGTLLPVATVVCKIELQFALQDHS